ncbi:hypothetical protein PMIN01_00793 [Paraphaeosphaeria minitans]|uniref:Uncharacterized protein n=1 Tax=Paraphaeosphaeria minitans TaxID=565426 RepID=A0A9P6GTG6_9PLEO|nr:hypothetical protein PMIN01_00793 [Paraphaeosphaeria minitans]
MSLAAAHSKTQVEWLDGTLGEKVHERAYPPGNHRKLSSGSLGSWRTHMDALREDDVDWDIRIRTQLLVFSKAARKLSTITHDEDTQQAHPAFETKSQNPIELAKRSTLRITPEDTHNAPTEPYGCDWDFIWLGHCSADLPPPSPAAPDRIMLLNDFTVPSPQYLRLHKSSPTGHIATLYPPYTRVYHRATNNTLCTSAYAVTQRGARKILFQLGVRDFSKGFDFALSDYCAGLVKGNGNGLLGQEF